MARGYAKLSVKDLADASGVAASTIKRIEAVEGVPNSSASNLDRIQQVLQGHGIRFLEQGEVADGPGVSLETERAT
ncbi:MAG: helix-turn-helix transcriptional regulator [Maritimibacter sp.]|nr:helix-turn-helix transcriptional regulator [Maritimibacter sp.]